MVTSVVEKHTLAPMAHMIPMVLLDLNRASDISMKSSIKVGGCLQQYSNLMRRIQVYKRLDRGVMKVAPAAKRLTHTAGATLSRRLVFDEAT